MKPSTQRWIGFAIVVCVALAAWGYLASMRASREEAKSGTTNAVTVVSAPTPEPGAAVAPSPLVSSLPAPRTSNAPEARAGKEAAQNQIILSKVPSLKTLRAEIKENPHQTPPSLLRFSVEVGQRVRAVDNQAASRDLFQELSKCATDGSGQVPEQAKSICYLNARTLSEKDAGFKEEFQSLSERVSPRIRALGKLIQ